MNTNSNSYTIIYASVMVVIVAFLLATKKQILSALGVTEVEDAEKAFAEYVESDMIVAKDGSLSKYEGKFVTAYEKEYKENDRAHVFVCNVKGEKKYVIPVFGAGLWGAIWGYVALDEDKNTIFGTYFSHSSETPGLGAEIALPHFQSLFVGKHVMEGESVALSKS